MVKPLRTRAWSSATDANGRVPTTRCVRATRRQRRRPATAQAVHSVAGERKSVIRSGTAATGDAVAAAGTRTRGQLATPAGRPVRARRPRRGRRRSTAPGRARRRRRRLRGRSPRAGGGRSRPPSGRGSSVLDHVGQGLLHDAVGGELDARLTRRVALDARASRARRRRARPPRGRELVEARGRLGRPRPVGVAQHAEQPAQLGERPRDVAEMASSAARACSGRSSSTWAPTPACTATTDIEWATMSCSSRAMRRRSSATRTRRALALHLGPFARLAYPGVGRRADGCGRPRRPPRRRRTGRRSRRRRPHRAPSSRWHRARRSPPRR